MVIKMMAEQARKLGGLVKTFLQEKGRLELEQIKALLRKKGWDLPGEDVAYILEILLDENENINEEWNKETNELFYYVE